MEKSTKICTTCNIEYPIEYFYPKGGNRGKERRCQCKKCNSKNARGNYQKNKELYLKTNKIWRDKNPDKTKNTYLKNRYNITLEDFNDMLKNQDSKCGICNNPLLNTKKKIHVDHNHKTGKVRGLLCYNCNSGIGSLKDDIQILKNAILYLEKDEIGESIENLPYHINLKKYVRPKDREKFLS